MGTATAQATAGAAGPSEGLRAGWTSGRTKQEYTTTSGRHDHATFLERADASVRCTGLGARLLATADEARAGYAYNSGIGSFYLTTHA